MKSFHMKKIAATTIVASALLAAMVPAAQAVDLAPQAFNVTVNLTSACVINTGIAANLDFGTYTAITGGASIPNPSVTFTIDCTRGLAPSAFTFDAPGGGTNGVVAGLNYTLSAADALTTTGTAATAAPLVLGTADTRTVTITGGMVANQAGSGAGGPATDARTLVVTY